MKVEFEDRETGEVREVECAFIARDYRRGAYRLYDAEGNEIAETGLDNLCSIE